MSRFSHYTENEWYEAMIADAFHQAFPGVKPYGAELYDVTTRTKRNGEVVEVYTLKRGYTRADVPMIRPYMFFYFNSGTIGDSDNYVKIVQDALNKVAYVDDFQVRVPTPYVVVDPDVVERVDILLVPYDPDTDKHFLKVKDFVSIHAEVMDLYDDYEVERLHEKTVNQLVALLCPQDCPEYDVCFPRKKDDIIFCENRKK